MNASTFADEFVGCQFGDQRLNKRLVSLADALANKPNLSLPAAMRSKAELEGCYRFCSNPKVTQEKILRTHIQATHQRVAQLDFVLLVQDTTEIELKRPAQQVVGAGPLDCESRRGAFFHPTIAFDDRGLPLGMVGQRSWTRKEISKASKNEKNERRKKLPIEQKESHRWLEGFRFAVQTAAACPETTCVSVGDSESDIYELFVEAIQCEQPNVHLLIRAGQDRNTTDSEDWAEAVRQTAKLAEMSLKVRARRAKINKGKKSARNRDREARTAEIEIRKATVEVRRPKSHRGDGLPASIQVNVVLCEEPSPPPGEVAISWMLVTTLPIDTDEQIRTIINAYCVRWQIEVFFRTLKSGCRIEQRRFEKIDRILNALALFSVVAWRVLYLCHLGRHCPDLDCEVVFEPSEWKSVYAVLNIAPPSSGAAPKLNEVIRAIARLGGFIDRPKNDPGAQTLWIGLQRTYDLSSAWEAFGPESKNFCPDKDV